MALLQPSEYDEFYFDYGKAQGQGSAASVLAGFTKYERWNRFEGANSTGEFWKDKAANWVNHLALANKKVLELGCAKGFVVKDLRDAGVDAYGMDVSSYAIGECEEGMSQYLTQGDIRTDLDQYSNKEFDVVVSFRVIECLTDAEVAQLMDDCQRIGKKQVHIITVNSTAGAYYNFKTLQEWLALPWPKGTVLAAYGQESNYVIK